MSVVVCRADGTGVVLVAARIVVCSFNVDEDALRCWVDGAVAVPGGGFVSCCSFELDEDAFDSVTRVTLSIKKLGQTLASSAASPASKISTNTVKRLVEAALELCRDAAPTSQASWRVQTSPNLITTPTSYTSPPEVHHTQHYFPTITFLNPSECQVIETLLMRDLQTVPQSAVHEVPIKL